MEEALWIILCDIWTTDWWSSQATSHLLCCLGEVVEAILTFTNATEEEWKDYNNIEVKLDAFFDVWRNIILECASFNDQMWNWDIIYQQFIIELYREVKNCKYGNFTR